MGVEVPFELLGTLYHQVNVALVVMLWCNLDFAFYMIGM